MRTFTKNEEAYFRGLSLPRQLDYIERTWGVMPSISLDVVVHPEQGPCAVCTVAVLNPLLAAELMEPLPVIFTRRVRGEYTPAAHIADTLIRWVEAAEEHMASKSG
jgi:hypothetical protein